MRVVVLLLGVLCFFVAPAPPRAVAVQTGRAGTPRPYIYLSPQPGAANISPATALALRLGEPFARLPERNVFAVAGSRSGQHSGQLRLSDDRLTLLFYPDQPFVYDESVTVTIAPGLKSAGGVEAPAMTYVFHTLQRPMDDVALPSAYDDLVAPRAVQETNAPYVTFPELTSVMPVTVTSPAQGVGDGFLFMTGLNSLAMLMVDDSGEPWFIKQVPDGKIVTDFKRQDVDGVPYLTYHEGVSTNPGWTNGVYHVMDQSYNVVDSWTIGNGYGADLHDLQLLDNGHALMMSYTSIPYDLRPYGGPRLGAVIDVVIQEQDAQKNVVFEWHASQHLPLTDSFENLANSPVDYVHTNAIEVDNDDNLLISHRNTNSIIKVNRQTGQVMWLLGGRRNQFTFTNDFRFSRQHDIRRLPNGHITLFDNGNDRVLPYSRAVEYSLDEVGMRVTRVWQYVEDGGRFAPYMGSVQRLDNGNTVIGWGAVPAASEVRSNGVKALEMALGGRPYRVFRFPWEGQPAEAPRAAVAESGDSGQVTVYASWNGATEVESYEVYAGPSSGEMSLVATADRAGFETSVILANVSDDTCAFRVRPVAQDSAPFPFSNVTFRTSLPACRDLLSWNYLPLIVQ